MLPAPLLLRSHRSRRSSSLGVSLLLGLALSVPASARSQDDASGAPLDPIAGIPDLELLRPVLPGQARPAADAAGSEIRDAVAGRFDAITAAISQVQALIADTRADGQLDEAPAAGCRRYNRHQGAVIWDLTACLGGRSGEGAQVNFVFRSWSVRLAGAEPTEVASGDTVVRPPRRAGEQPTVRSGQVRYDFEALRAILGEGPRGRLGVTFEVGAARRGLRYELVGFTPQPGVPAITQVHEVEELAERGGQARLVVHADVVRLTPGGVTQEGQDGSLDALGVGLAWNELGAARADVIACPEARGGVQTCGRLHACWTDTGAPTFQSHAPEGEEAWLAWSAIECPALDSTPGPPDPRRLTEAWEARAAR